MRRRHLVDTCPTSRLKYPAKSFAFLRESILVQASRVVDTTRIVTRRLNNSERIVQRLATRLDTAGIRTDTKELFADILRRLEQTDKRLTDLLYGRNVFDDRLTLGLRLKYSVTEKVPPEFFIRLNKRITYCDIGAIVVHRTVKHNDNSCAISRFIGTPCANGQPGERSFSNFTRGLYRPVSYARLPATSIDEIAPT